jgi:monoamine oxidase
MSRSALLHNPAANGGKPMQLRTVVNDTRGHVAELLAKALNKEALDQDITAADKERMVAFLKTYGDLNSDMFYKGSQRAGLKTAPGAAGEVGTAFDPVDMSALLSLDMWNGALFEESIDMQATMFQPKGGMDRIPAAFARALGPSVIKRGCEVKQIRKTASGVRVSYKDQNNGKESVVEAAYCISTIPLPVLAKIDGDFSPAYKAAIGRAIGRESVKVGWQAPRFWEGPQYQIYGGISFTKAANALVWYPSHGMHTPKGVMLGAYSGNPALTSLSHTDQIEYTRKVIDQMHPGCGALLEKPLRVQWAKTPYSMGIYVSTTPADYDLLGSPDGPIYFAGDYLAHVGAWQEGAMRSAHRTIAMLDATHRKGQPVTAFRVQ